MFRLEIFAVNSKGKSETVIIPEVHSHSYYFHHVIVAKKALFVVIYYLASDAPHSPTKRTLFNTTLYVRLTVMASHLKLFKFGENLH